MRYWHLSQSPQQQQRVIYLLLVVILVGMVIAFWLVYPVIVFGVCALAVLLALPFLCCYHHCCRKRQEQQQGEYRAASTTDGRTGAGADVDAEAADGPPSIEIPALSDQRNNVANGGKYIRLNAGVPNAGYEVSVDERVDAPRTTAALRSERQPLYAYFEYSIKYLLNFSKNFGKYLKSFKNWQNPSNFANISKELAKTSEIFYNVNKNPFQL